MPSIDKIYSNLLLEHYHNPRNYGSLPQPDSYQKGINPLCGDTIEIFLNLHQQTIHQIQFLSQGCSICRASASMMTEQVIGQSISKTGKTAHYFYSALQDGNELPDEEQWQNLKILTIVRNFPARIKCALLPWQTLSNALEEIPC